MKTKFNYQVRYSTYNIAFAHTLMYLYFQLCSVCGFSPTCLKFPGCHYLTMTPARKAQSGTTDSSPGVVACQCLILSQYCIPAQAVCYNFNFLSFLLGATYACYHYEEHHNPISLTSLLLSRENANKIWKLLQSNCELKF